MSVKDIQQAILAKQAEQTGDDEGHLVSGEQETYPDPPGHSPQEGDDVTHGTGVLREAAVDRLGFLDKAFKTLNQASAADKAVVSRNFETSAASRHEPHSVLLQKKAQAHTRDSLTLSQRVQRVLMGKRW